MRHLLAILQVLLTTSLAACADSNADALRKIGLTGSWSTDCAQKSGPRFIFQVPSYWGKATMAITGPNFNTQGAEVGIDLISAALVTEDKITIVFHPFAMDRGQKMLDARGPQTITLEKQGSKMVGRDPKAPQPV